MPELENNQAVTAETTPDAATAPEITTPQTIEDAQAELVRTRAALKAANAEAADRRHKLKQYEEAEQQRKEAEMTEVQKLQEQLKRTEQEKAEALQQAQKTATDAAILNAAIKAGFNDPQDAIDFLANKMQGKQAAEIEQAVVEFAKSKPYMIRKPVQVGNPTNPGGAQTPVDEMKRLRELGLR